jgi:hypothetical protein
MTWIPPKGGSRKSFREIAVPKQKKRKEKLPPSSWYSNLERLKGTLPLPLWQRRRLHTGIRSFMIWRGVHSGCTGSESSGADDRRFQRIVGAILHCRLLFVRYKCQGRMHRISHLRSHMVLTSIWQRRRWSHGFHVMSLDKVPRSFRHSKFFRSTKKDRITTCQIRNPHSLTDLCCLANKQTRQW